MCKITIEMDESDPRFAGLLTLMMNGMESVPTRTLPATAPVTATPGLVPVSTSEKSAKPSTTTSPAPVTMPMTQPVTMPMTQAVSANPVETVAGGPNLDDVIKALQACIVAQKASGAKARLASLGVGKPAELLPARYAEAIAVLSAA